MWEYVSLSINTTMPFVLLALLGILLKHKGFIGDKFVSQGNKVVFYFGIPTTIFRSIHRANLSEVLDLRFLAFNSAWLIFFFLVVWLLAYKFIKDKTIVSSFVNTAYRSSLSVVAPPLLWLMFYVGNHPEMNPDIYAKGILMVSVLLILSYATAAVLFAVHDTKANSAVALLFGILKSVAKNPVVIGVVAGLVTNVLMNTLNFELPVFVTNTINPLAGIVMPLAMICVGANLAFHGFDVKFKYVAVSVLVKLIVMPVAAVLVALLFGFTGSDLTIIMILNALPMAVGAYVMQAELGGDTYIGASALMLTMTLSSITLTVFIFAFRVVGILV
ncbi:MAG: AEC family transporter [Defluviitaleaceae bacterium]|nr:AEC family transporter [Defluviitaleaceae bacterium]